MQSCATSTCFDAFLNPIVAPADVTLSYSVSVWVLVQQHPT